MFDRDTLEGKFARIGARMKPADGTGSRRRLGVAIALDVRSDRRGEFFEVIRRPDAEAEAKNWGWRVMQRNAEVYVRGRVRHADHRTITLHGWHRVLMNTENQSRAMRNVAFLD
ncbi:MAG: hypothetical protein JWN86_1366 [Planctomycetota bacterium]|nr:hypothetical protein [Planctomycetota bacterium]